MTTMDQVHNIRQMFFEQGLSISGIAKKTGLSWKTVQKYVDKTDFNEPSPADKPAPEFCPKLDPFKGIIDNWLAADLKAPRKQRHTSKRVYERLLKETDGFNCSYRLVAQYVAEKKSELFYPSKSGYIPLVHNPAEAQGDFGHAEFIENGRLCRGKYFVLSFPYSNQGYIQLCYGENMECLLESLKAIFEHIGGVPTEIWFDNTSTIVSSLRGSERILTDRFTRFKEHYGFKSLFMNPASGWEKGSVECKVGYSRRNLLVPVPEFKSLKEYNKYLLAECDKDANREHYRRVETIEYLFEKDKQGLRPLPQTDFETDRFIQVTTNKWGKFTLDNGKHEYSSSPQLHETSLWIKLSASEVHVLDRQANPIAVHRRLYGQDKQESMDWRPYLEYIAKKPRSLRNSGIYGMMPASMQVFMDSCDSSERGKILKTLAELTKRTGFDSAMETVNQAIKLQARDADSLKSLYRLLYDDLPNLPAIQHINMPNLRQMPADLDSYDVFLSREVNANG